MLCLAMPIGGAARLSAHDPLRFDGTVVKFAKGVLTIQTIDNGKDTRLDITFDARTTVKQTGRKVPRSALKTGLHVIVDALGCIDDPRIDGVAVYIVPPGSRVPSVGDAATVLPGVPPAPTREEGTEIPNGDRVPTVALRSDGLGKSGWSFTVVTTLGLTMAMGPYQPMRGHVHVDVDGKPTLMIAEKHFTLTDLAPGKHTVRVVLSGLDHRTLLHGGLPIAASQDIVVPATAR